VDEVIPSEAEQFAQRVRSEEVQVLQANFPLAFTFLEGERRSAAPSPFLV
jgi:hypothetical protein